MDGGRTGLPEEGAAVMGLIVDLFAGGGGTSLGIERALGRSPDIAVNHDPEAVAMHKANHPHTKHYCENVWAVNPREATAGRPVDFLWASPDCKHFSKAKGGKPLDKKIRSLAWVIVKWAAWTRPQVIAMENVEEFRKWGPLDRKGRPIKALEGTTFSNFVFALRKLGYKVDYRDLKACDYGAPTSRKRFFLVARRDGAPIVWPERTYGIGTGRPYRTAAECIDWSIPCPSIFGREKELAPNTLRRIAKGIVRYVLSNPNPFIVSVSHGGNVFRDVVTPYLTKFRGGAVGQELVDPLPTITAGGESKRPAGSPHALGLVVPALVKQTFSDKPCQEMEIPLHTITTQHNKFALCAAFIAQYHGEQSGREMRGQALDGPLMVVDANPRYAICAAHLAKHYGGVVGQAVESPVGTITAADHHSLVACTLMRQFGTSTGAPVDRPVGTVMPEGRGKTGLVAAFLAKYYGAEREGMPLNGPLHTICGKDKFAVVTVSIGGEEYAVYDIGMRMLQPRELFRAQGFGDDYIIDLVYEGKYLSKSAQVRMVGNSVCPPIAEAIVKANCAFMQEEREVA